MGVKAVAGCEIRVVDHHYVSLLLRHALSPSPIHELATWKSSHCKIWGLPLLLQEIDWRSHETGCQSSPVSQVA